LNDFEADASALNTDDVEDVRRPIYSMVPAAVDPDDSSLFHLLAIFRGDLPGECDYARDDQE
jgi:hypothetical protein